MTIDEILELDKGPKLPQSRERGIGIVGAGAIVNAGHLPAYRKAGFTEEDLRRSVAESVVRLAISDEPMEDATATRVHGYLMKCGHETEAQRFAERRSWAGLIDALSGAQREREEIRA